jgi:hypothetical protein
MGDPDVDGGKHEGLPWVLGEQGTLEKGTWLCGCGRLLLQFMCTVALAYGNR